MLGITEELAMRMSGRAREDARALDTLRQASLVGALADQVVLATLRVQSGDRDAASDPALREASDLLARAVRQLSQPFDITEEDNALDAVRLMNAMDDDSPSQSASDDVSGGRTRTAERLQHLAEAVQKVREGSAEPEDIRDVRQQFDALSQATLMEANEAVRPSTTAGAWTQARAS